VSLDILLKRETSQKIPATKGYFEDLFRFQRKAEEAEN